MTTKDKLQKLIEKAVEGGWKPIDAEILGVRVVEATPRIYVTIECKIKTITSYFDDETEAGRMYIGEIIFNHDFAKALFGEESKWVVTSVAHFDRSMTAHNKIVSNAEHHLQQAVISEDPISYLYGVVFDE